MDRTKIKGWLDGLIDTADAFREKCVLNDENGDEVVDCFNRNDYRELRIYHNHMPAIRDAVRPAIITYTPVTAYKAVEESFTYRGMKITSWHTNFGG